MPDRDKSIVFPLFKVLFDTCITDHIWDGNIRYQILWTKDIP